MTRARILTLVAVIGIGIVTLKPASTTPEGCDFLVLCGPYAAVDALLNVVLFVPLAVALARVPVRPLPAIVGMAALSLTIELLQLAGQLGRQPSVGDVLANTAGGALGYVLATRFAIMLSPGVEAIRWLMSGWFACWLVAQIVTAYSRTVVVPDPPYYAQIARPPSDSRREQFQGTVVSARLAGQALTNAPIVDATRIGSQLHAPEGATLAVTLVSGRPTASRAEIVNVSGPVKEEIVGLDQDADRLVFAVRTGANTLRLRPLQFRVGDVFSQDSIGDTLVVSARYTPVVVVVAAGRNQVRRTIRVEPRMSDGWRLVWPVPASFDGRPGEAMLSFAYFALFVLPAAFSLRMHFRTAVVSARRQLMAWTLFGTGVVAGLVVPAEAYGLPRPAVVEWLAIGTGVALGLLATIPARGEMR